MVSLYILGLCPNNNTLIRQKQVVICAQFLIEVVPQNSSTLELSDTKIADFYFTMEKVGIAC